MLRIALPDLIRLVDRIALLKAENMTDRQIGIIVNLPTGKVIELRHKYNIKQLIGLAVFDCNHGHGSLAFLKSMLMKGMSYVDLAPIMGISVATIRNYGIALSIDHNYSRQTNTRSADELRDMKSMLYTGATYISVANKYGISRERVRQYNKIFGLPGRINQPLNEEKEAEVLELIEQKKKRADIAKEVKISLWHLRKLIKAKGLEYKAFINVGLRKDANRYEAIVSDLKDGVSYYEIGRKHGIHVVTAYKLRKKLGLPERNRGRKGCAGGPKTKEVI